MVLSKTDYILFRECAKNTWFKIHKPDLYYAEELSDFEKHIIETGNEVEGVARKLYPKGVMVEGRDEAAQNLTAELIAKKQPAIFQPVFMKDGFLAAVDILEYSPESKSWDVIEIKASNEADKKRHYYDLAFQVNLLRKCGLEIGTINLMHLDSEYTRQGELDLVGVFKKDDLTKEINALCPEVAVEMEQALQYVSADKEPPGTCVCLYKGRSNHCTTFHYSNPLVPKYSVHDIVRIGLSKKKLADLIDGNHFDIHEVPEDLELSESQRNQVNALLWDKIIKDDGNIRKELAGLQYPLYFIDYETFPSALPMFDGFHPYQQIPFQYSLFVMEGPSFAKASKGEVGANGSAKLTTGLKHFEYLHEKSTDPSKAFVDSMRKQIGPKGSIIVWSKKFECTINKQIAERVPEAAAFIEDVNSRTYDLMDIFTKQYFVHKDFKGSTSIKKVLPVLVPELSYKDLAIQEGGTASSSWLQLIGLAGKLSAAEKAKLKKDMLAYCERDTMAMVRILEELQKVISK